MGKDGTRLKFPGTESDREKIILMKEIIKDLN